MKKIRILFVLPSLACGGSEKIFVSLINALNKEIFEPRLVFGYKGPLVENVINKDLLINLNRKKVVLLLPKLIRLISKEKPDLIFSTLSHLNAALCIAKAMKLIQCPIIIRESVLLSSLYSHSQSIYEKNVVSTAIKAGYRMASHVICQAEAMAEDIRDFCKLHDTPITVIHNPIEKIPPFCKKKESDLIIAVGRLYKQKNYPLLIEAFANIMHLIPHQLHIIGEGPEKSHLSGIIKKRNLTQRIKLKGFIKDPWADYRSSSLFVLASLYEGFPNVLLEAMANSTPVVSTDCPSGPNEIIENEVNGLLASNENVDSLASQMLKILRNPDMSIRFKTAAYKSVQDFRIEKVILKYESTFEAVL